MMNKINRYKFLSSGVKKLKAKAFIVLIGFLFLIPLLTSVEAQENPKGYFYNYEISDRGDIWHIEVAFGSNAGTLSQSFNVDKKYSKQAVINYYEKAKADYLKGVGIEYAPQIVEVSELQVAEGRIQEHAPDPGAYYDFEVVDGGDKWIINIKYGDSYWDLSDTQEQGKRFPKEAVMNVYEKVKAQYLSVYGVTYEPKHYGSSITKNPVVAEIVEPHVEAPSLPVSPVIPAKGDKYVGESAFPEIAKDETLYVSIAVILALVLCAIIVVLKWKP